MASSNPISGGPLTRFISGLRADYITRIYTTNYDDLPANRFSWHVMFHADLRQDGQLDPTIPVREPPNFEQIYHCALPVEPERSSVTGRALLEGRIIHIADVQADPDYTWAEAQRLGGFRTILGVPMLPEGVPIGVLALTRSEVRPFTDKQIELVSTFADQAAIAIENVQLFEEIQDKNRQLAEASQHNRSFSLT
jgi:GAF domain-containing protein